MPERSRDNENPSRSHLLTGGLRATVFWLALPVLCEQFLSFLVGFYDTWLSGRIGSQATTAVGLAAYVSWLASMLVGLVATGTTALVARHWGAGDFPQANRITNRSMTMALVMGLVVYAFIFTAAPGFAAVLRMDDETSRVVVNYLRIEGFGHIFTSLSLVGAAALRGAGDMRSPMLILGLVSIVNVLASTALVFGVGPVSQLGLQRTLIAPMGIDGIVAGTVIARVAGGLLMIVALARGLSGLRLARGELTLRGNTVRRILRIGAPAALDGAIMWGGQLLFLMIIANLGGGSLENAVFAAHIVGIRIEAITYLPAVAWGYAASTMVGQSLGAQNSKRAARVGHEAALQCSLLGLIITVVFFFGARGIYELMHEEAAVREVGIPAFRMLAFFQVPLMLAIVYVYALRGAGDTRYPMWITVVGLFACRLPVAWLFGIVLDGGLFGAWIGMCAGMLFRATLVMWRYVRGGWMQTTV